MPIPRRIAINKRDSRDYITQALEAARMLDDLGPDPVANPRRPVGYSAQDSGPAPIQPGGLSEGTFNAALQKLLAATGGKVKVVSGKRSTQRQAQLWAQALKDYGSPEKARKWVAPPGRSKHESGVAADLGGDLKLAKNLASKFGLYFPMAHEPWHVELIGTRPKKK